MADHWSFKTVSECDLFLTHVGTGGVGSVFSASVFGVPHPTIPSVIVRQNYSCWPSGIVEVTPPNDSGVEPYLTNPPTYSGPWGHNMIAWPGIWMFKTIEANEYVCCTAKSGHEVSEVFSEYYADAVHTVERETWAISILGDAIINGVAIPRWGIAHKVDGEMDIETTGMVVCLTEAFAN